MSTSLEAARMAVETEVAAKATRRRFTNAEKLRVLREADRCRKPGELGALQHVMGHASITTTQRCAKLSDEAVMKEAMRLTAVTT